METISGSDKQLVDERKQIPILSLYSPFNIVGERSTTHGFYSEPYAGRPLLWNGSMGSNGTEEPTLTFILSQLFVASKLLRV